MRALTKFTPVHKAVFEELSDNEGWKKIYTEFRPKVVEDKGKTYKFDKDKNNDNEKLKNKENKKMNILEKIFSVKNVNEQKVVTLLGIKMKFKQGDIKLINLLNKNIELQKQNKKLQIHNNNRLDELQNQYNEIKELQGYNSSRTDELQNIISSQFWQLNHKIDAINANIVKIFQYETGIELNKNYIMEREIVFDPNDVPQDHYNRYVFARNILDSSDTVADIACTCGYGSKILSENAAKVIGVDINEAVVNFAKKVYGCDKIDFYAQDAQDLNLGYQFDKVVSFETIEHIPHPEKFLQTIHNLLKDGGKIICSVPNETVCPYSTAGNHFHHRHYTENEFKELLSQNGFELEQMYFQDWNDNCTIHTQDRENSSMNVLVAIAKKV